MFQACDDACQQGLPTVLAAGSGRGERADAVRWCLDVGRNGDLHLLLLVGLCGREQRGGGDGAQVRPLNRSTTILTTHRH